MDGWRGLLVLTIGLGIGVGLWFGVAALVAPPAVHVAQAKPQGAKGISGSTKPTAADADDPSPVAFLVARNAVELQTTLEAAPFVHRGLPGPVLYVVTFRSCPSCAEFKDNEWSALEAAGVDIRWLVYARRDSGAQARSLAPERAVVAELALNRSYQLLEAWFAPTTAEEYYQTAQLPPAAESSPLRLAALQKMRAVVDSLSAVTDANGQDLAIPSFFWRDGAGWHGMIGYDQASFAGVKAALFQATAPPVASTLPPLTLPAPQ